MRADSFKFRKSTPEDISWFIETAKYNPSAAFGGITVYNESGLCGMVGLDHWTHTGVWTHFAFKTARAIVPLWRELLQYLASHGYRILIGVTPGDNVRALRVIKRLGWREMYQQKDGWKQGVPLVFSEYRIQ